MCVFVRLPQLEIRNYLRGWSDEISSEWANIWQNKSSDVWITQIFFCLCRVNSFDSQTTREPIRGAGTQTTRTGLNCAAVSNEPKPVNVWKCGHENVLHRWHLLFSAGSSAGSLNYYNNNNLFWTSHSLLCFQSSWNGSNSCKKLHYWFLQDLMPREAIKLTQLCPNLHKILSQLLSATSS